MEGGEAGSAKKKLRLAIRLFILGLHRALIKQLSHVQGFMGVPRLVGCLPSMHEVPGSIPPALPKPSTVIQYPSSQWEGGTVSSRSSSKREAITG